MINREKVIKGLGNLYDRLLDAAKLDSIAMLDASMVAGAIALLKEQEAVKPISDGDDYYRCGSCNAYVAFPNGDCKKSFCEKCGRAVDWNE